MKLSDLKKPSLFFLPFLICYLVLNIVVYFSDIYANEVTRLISHVAGRDVTIGRATVSPFEGIKLSNVYLKDGLGQSLAMEEVVLKYSFPELLKRDRKSVV